MNSSRDVILVLGAAVLLEACSSSGNTTIVEIGGKPGVGGGSTGAGASATSSVSGGKSAGTGTRTGSGGTSGGSGGTHAGNGGSSAGGITGMGGKSSGGSKASSSSTGTGTSSAGGVGTSSAGGSTSATGGSQTTSSCAPGVPITSQIPRLLNSQYDNVIRDLLGVTALAGANGSPPSSLLNTDSTGPMNSYMWKAYQDAAEMVASEVMAGSNRSKFITCDPSATNCLKNTITTFSFFCNVEWLIVLEPCV